MRIRALLLLVPAVVMALPVSAGDKKKKQQTRALLERMESVPCGAKQRGVSGVGSVWASIGVTKMSSDEKLCPQYVLRTDDMDYEIRPLDKKHPEVLPVGQEVIYKLKKDRMTVKLVDGPDNKARTYQVVAMVPNQENSAQNAPEQSPRRP
jgi:hypothetical protein